MGEKEDNQIPKGPDWLSNPFWWVGIVAFALGLYFVRHLF